MKDFLFHAKYLLSTELLKIEGEIKYLELSILCKNWPYMLDIVVLMFNLLP